MLYRPNPLFEQEFRREPRTKLAMLGIATEVKGVVRVLAPRMSGDYRDSIVAGEDAEGAYVATTDFAGHIIEWGSVNNPPMAPIRRAVKAAGLILRELPRS